MKTAMILAAGLGTRMRPLTETTPKPLVEVGGQTLLQYSLDAAESVGIKHAVVNVHHLAGQIEDYLADQRHLEIKISDERAELLDSGGGIANALPLIQDDAFALLNADTFWVDEISSAQSSLSRLIGYFDETRMDILLMCVPISRTTGHTGKGDFKIGEDGTLVRFKGEGEDALIYAGAAILHRRIFTDISEKKFSLNRCFDDAVAQGRLFGQVMNGHWLTVGTVDAISEAENKLSELKSISP